LHDASKIVCAPEAQESATQKNEEAANRWEWGLYKSKNDNSKIVTANGDRYHFLPRMRPSMLVSIA
jgi:hypothetical protein